jgi:hypothetical protein
MEKYIISYGDKDYEVKEPSIKNWLNIENWKFLYDESHFVIKIISECTGLAEDDIRKADWYDILAVGNGLIKYLTNISDKFESEFVFEGQKYKFINLPNLTFGEFIDLDTFLQKDELERKKGLSFLMALLYREVDESNNLIEYDGSKVENRAKKFDNLPVRYVHGAMSFFFLSERVLREHSLKFSLKKLKKMINQEGTKLMRRISLSTGVGSGH